MSYWSFSGRGRQVSARGAELFHIRYGQRRPLHSPRSVDHQAATTRARPPPRRSTSGDGAAAPYCCCEDGRAERIAVVRRRVGVQTCRRTAASGATSTSRLRRRFTLLPAKLSSYWDVSYTSIVETIRTFRAERCGPPDGANSCNHGSL